MTGLAADGAEVAGVPLEIVGLAGAAVVLLGVLAVRVSSRLGLPSLLLYLGIGVLIGEAGLGLRFDDAALSQTLGLAALVVILTEGGLSTRWSAVRPALPLAVVLSTLGVAISVGVVAGAAVLLLDLSWRSGLLLGAIVSSTDAAAVFSTLRALGLPPRLTATLEMESGFNDAPVVILVTLLSSGAAGSPAEIVGLVLYELVAGAGIGIGVATGAAWLLRRGALPAAGLYPLSVFSVAVGSYALATVAHASGFLAAYLTGLVLGNATLPHRHATLGFVEGLAWLAQIGLFVLLGLLASPQRLGSALLPALQFFDIVFVLVVVYTVVQGTTLGPLAKLLKLSSDARPRDLEVDAAPLEDLGADLLQVRIPATSRMHGVLVRELRLPEGAAVSLLVRAGQAFVPGPDTQLRRGDQLLVVTTSPARAAVERRLHAVGRGGRLAGWLGEDRRPS